MSEQKNLSSCIKDGESLNVRIVSKLDIMMNGVVSHVNDIKPFNTKAVDFNNCSEVRINEAKLYSTNSYDLAIIHIDKGLLLGIRNINEGESNFSWWSSH